MPERLAADAVVVLHFAFILFVIAGGLTAFRWRWIIALHIPAALWGAAIEFFGWTCPLTPLEQSLRHTAGQSGYPGSFVDQYLIPVIYPPGLDRPVQLALGTLVVTLNVAIYSVLVYRYRAGKGRTPTL